MEWFGGGAPDQGPNVTLDAIVMVIVAGAPTPLALAGVSTTVNVPEVLGVPLITPVEAFNERPPGKPEATKLVAAGVVSGEYVNAEPTVPLAVRVPPITGVLAAGVIRRFSVAVPPVPLLLVATSCTEDEPGSVGTPVIEPVLVLSTIHAGAPTTSYEVGELDATIWYVNG
jgi:hypothetical protein